MNLYIDVGNTATKFAIDKNDKLDFLFAISSSEILNDVTILTNRLELININNIYVSSVVPAISQNLKSYFQKHNKNIEFINSDFDAGIKIEVDDKNELGSDLLCDLAGANKETNYPFLVIDLGTATKFLFVDNKGVFSTCAIIQGLELSLLNLSKNTALLPKLSFSEVKPLLENRNTKDVLMSSAYYSQVDMINGMVRRYLEAAGYPFNIILTGGNIDIIKKDLNFTYKEVHNLCLEGIEVLVKNAR